MTDETQIAIVEGEERSKTASEMAAQRSGRTRRLAEQVS